MMEPIDFDALLDHSQPGLLHLGGARMALFDLESGFWAIYRQLSALIGVRLTRSVFQQAGANGGASFANSFMKTINQTGPDAFSACLQIYQAAGFGEFEIMEIEWPLGHIEINARQTFEAWMLTQNYHHSEAPCCSYTAGVLVGFINVITGRKDVVCIEQECQGKGDAVCRFKLLPASEAANQEVVAFSSDPGLGHQINLMQMLFERMPMGIAVIDRQFRIQRYNPTWEDFARRYGPPSSPPITPGIGYFEHLKGSESVVLPLFEKTLSGETVRENGVRIEVEGVVTYWDIVLAPLEDNGEIIGILNIAVDATESMTARFNMEQRVLERTQEIERRRQIADSLRDMMLVLNSERSSQEIFDYITERSAKLLGADACLIYSVEGNRLTNESNYHLPEAFTSLRSGEIFWGEANRSMLDGTIVQIKDAASYLNHLINNDRLTEFQKQWYGALKGSFASYFAFPLSIRNHFFGGLVFYYQKQHEFDEEDLQLGAMLGEQAALAIENNRLYQAEQERRRELQMLLDVAETANSTLDQDELIIKTLELLVSLVSASRAGIILLDDETGRLGPYILIPKRDIAPEDLSQIISACEAVIKTGEILNIIPDETAGLMEPGVLLPLQTRGRILGVLGIINPPGAIFSADQIALFKSIAEQLSGAIENAKLFKKAEETAIFAERNRLARDLHDAVTQTLFSASMIAEVIPKIWESKPEEAKRRLEELRQLTRGALSEMRTLLVELRPSALEDTDLNDLIRHQVNAFIARSRVDVTFTNRSSHNPSPEIKEMVYRIAQEALNNIAKHAEAAHVNVELISQVNRLELIIQDNGQGFEPENEKVEGLGLGIMAERAKAVGAQLQIDSKIGEGTRVRLLWEKNAGQQTDDTTRVG